MYVIQETRTIEQAGPVELWLHQLLTIKYPSIPSSSSPASSVMVAVELVPISSSIWVKGRLHPGQITSTIKNITWKFKIHIQKKHS